MVLALTGSPTGGAVDLPSLGSLGIAGALVLVIVYLLAANRTDRSQYREALASLTAQYSADISALRKRVDDLEAEVDLERDERRRAQDNAAEASRRAAVAEAGLQQLRQLWDGGAAGGLGGPGAHRA